MCEIVKKEKRKCWKGVRSGFFIILVFLFLDYFRHSNLSILFQPPNSEPFLPRYLYNHLQSVMPSIPLNLLFNVTDISRASFIFSLLHALPSQLGNEDWLPPLLVSSCSFPAFPWTTLNINSRKIKVVQERECNCTM